MEVQPDCYTAIRRHMMKIKSGIHATSQVMLPHAGAVEQLRMSCSVHSFLWTANSARQYQWNSSGTTGVVSSCTFGKHFGALAADDGCEEVQALTKLVRLAIPRVICLRLSCNCV